MLPAHANPILRHVRRLISGDAPPDRDLLRAYLETHDESAFALLVERHGPMVLGVCQTVLGHRQDAEDAFQATFLVLARNARSIRRLDRLGSWLHGVAYRVALKARAAAARRREVEAKALARVPGSLIDNLTWGEVRAILHAELAQLPERLREPLVLCYLEGLTQDEAARRLGWTVTTLKGRLQRGRNRLRRRLERRGLAPAALGAVALTGQAFAVPVTMALKESVIHAVRGSTPAAVAILAEGVGGTLGPARCWVLTVLLGVAATLAGGMILIPHKPAFDDLPAAVARDEAGTPRTDQYGDPLPAGAVTRLGPARFNPGDSVNALHFAPDGKTIISDGLGHLCLWDAATGKLLRQFHRAHASLADPTVLLPDGKTMVFLALDDHVSDVVQFWDLERGRQERVTPLPVLRDRSPDQYLWSALTPDGRLAAIHNPLERMRVFDTATGKELYQLPRESSDIQAFAFAGSDRLVTAGKNEVIEIWDAKTGKRVRDFAHGAGVAEMAASRDGRWLATIPPYRYGTPPTDKELLRVWDLSTGTLKHALKAPPNERWVRGMQFGPDNQTLFASRSYEGRYDATVSVTVWDLKTGALIRELAWAGAPRLAVSPDGSRLASANHYDAVFGLWDLHSGRRLSLEESRHAHAWIVRLFPAGDRAVTIASHSLSIWDTGTGRRLNSIDVPLRPPSASWGNISSDCRYAATFAESAERIQLIIWDVAAHQRLHTIPLAGPTDRVSCSFAPASSILATCQSGKESLIRLWEVRTGKEIQSFSQSRVARYERLSFTADGKTLFIAGNVRDLAAFDVADGHELFFWPGILQPNRGRPWRSLTVSPDGRTVACVSGDSRDGKPVPDRVTLADARTGKVLRRWSDSGKGSHVFEQMAFSPDGRLLASSDLDAVHLWEVATGKEVHTFRGHIGDIQSLAFGANGRRLVSASTDSTVLVWDWPLAVGATHPLDRGLDEKHLAAWWTDLAGADARRAYAAIWRLAQAPEASVPFLRRHLKPVTDADMTAIQQHLKDLDAEAFTAREKASRQLEAAGPAVAAALHQALEKKPSLEMRRRIERLLETLDSRPLTGEPLRSLRALTALEYAGSAEARRLLSELAAGAPGGWLTYEAKAACERIASATSRSR